MTADTRKLDLPLLLTIVVCMALVVLVAVLLLQAWFRDQVAREHVDKIVTPPVTELLQLRAEQRSNLENYTWLDQETDRVQIPIERAMERVVQDNEPSAGGQR